MAGFQEKVSVLFDTDVALGGIRKFQAELAKTKTLTESLDNTDFQSDIANVMQGRDPETGQFLSSKDMSRLELAKNRFRALSRSSNLASSSLGRIGVMATAGAEAISEMSVNTRGLQMRLLGLQFTALTTAFIFGGLAASALGAVGVFKILGNMLKFFFLPSALGVLDQVLKLQNAVLGLSESTRKMVGDLMLGIATASVFIGIFAALGKAVLAVVGFLGTLSGWLGSLALTITGTTAEVSSLTGALSAIGSGGIIGGLSSVLSTIASYIPVIALIAGAVTALFTLFKRFPNILNPIINWMITGFELFAGVIMAAFKTLQSIIMGAFNIIQGVVTVIAGLLTGQFGKAKKGLIEIFRGLEQIIIAPFLIALDHLVNTFIPAMMDIGKGLVNALASAVVGIGEFVFSLLKGVLPDWVIGILKKGGGMLKGAGSLVGSAARAAGNIVGKMTQFQFTGPSIQNPTFGNQGGQPPVQNNNINVERVEVNNNEETPIETGRLFGEGLAQGLNNKTGNFSTGT